MNTEWKVPISSLLASSPWMLIILSRISSAAFFVKVKARIRSGRTPWDISRAIRVVSTLVFPEPAPATMSIGPSVCCAASLCAGLNRLRADSIWADVSIECKYNDFLKLFSLFSACILLYDFTRRTHQGCSLRPSLHRKRRRR